MKHKGFTFIEIMVVLAILGIIAGIFMWNLRVGVRRAELRDATNQIAADFRRARSTAQKGSSDVTISWSANGDGKIVSYTVAGQNRNIPNNVYLECSIGCQSGNKITYQAPYGELGATGMVFDIKSPQQIPSMQVRVVGVTGKIIVVGGS